MGASRREKANPMGNPGRMRVAGAYGAGGGGRAGTPARLLQVGARDQESTAPLRSQGSMSAAEGPIDRRFRARLGASLFEKIALVNAPRRRPGAARRLAPFAPWARPFLPAPPGPAGLGAAGARPEGKAGSRGRRAGRQIRKLGPPRSSRGPSSAPFCGFERDSGRFHATRASIQPNDFCKQAEQGSRRPVEVAWGGPARRARVPWEGPLSPGSLRFPRPQAHCPLVNASILESQQSALG